MPNVREKLSELKSVKCIEDRNDVLTFLNERSEKSGDVSLGVQLSPRGEQVHKVTPAGIQSKVATPSADETRRMAEAVGLKWTDDFLKEDGTPRVIPYFPSNEMVDRHGDIVLQNFDFTSFNVAGQILFCHDWAGLGIGRSIFHEVRQVQFTEFGYIGPAMFSFALFYGPETYAFADQVYRIASIRGMPSVSIGFFPGIIIHVEDDEERAKLGLGRWGVLLDNNDIVEYSPCVVPANTGALDAQLRSAAKKLKQGDLPVLREMLRRSVPVEDAKELDQCARTVWKEMFEQKSEPMEDPQAPIPGIDEKLEALKTEMKSELARTQETVIHVLATIREGFEAFVTEDEDPPQSPEDDPSEDDVDEEEAAEFGVDIEDGEDDTFDPDELDDEDLDHLAEALDDI